MSLTGAAAPITCYATGTGNIEGDGPGDPIVSSSIDFLAKIGDSTAGNTSLLSATGFNSNGPGTVTVTQAVSGYANLIIALKMGQGLGDPDWFAWSVPNIAAVYSWAWTQGGQNGLSHVNLYGQIPLPAAAWLLIGGLAGPGESHLRNKASPAG